MHKITESSIEQYSIGLLEKQGFSYIYGPEIAPDRDVQVPRAQDVQKRPPDSATPIRQSFEEVLLPDKLKTSIARNILADTIPDLIITNYRVFLGSSTNERKL